MMRKLVATYRFQLRDGVDFDAIAARLPWLVELGISHVYLAPVFSARTGSTHGYDVTDPNSVDPVLGGQAAFERFCDSAQQAGLGIVLDIVPNHMAFTPENPYLRDVLRHGRDSRFAPVFDIDWDKGPILFPLLDAPLGVLLDEGRIGIGTDADGPCLKVYDQCFPLRDGTHLPANDARLDEASLRTLIDAQHWRLGHWREDAHGIVHRRFFNITDLIGVRQEDPDVFELTHRWVFEQVEAGRIDGLRIDHIDGLAQPRAYLQRLRERVGDLPVWVEKIVKPGEPLPAWPVEGLSGYEFIAPVTRLLTDPYGLAQMRATAEGAVPADYHAEVRKVRRALLADDLKPELDRLTAVAVAALAEEPEPGPPADSREIGAAIAALAEYWPVYRSYSADGLPNTATLRVVAGEAHLGGTPLDGLEQVADLFAAPGPEATLFRARFEQLTGALTAKSEEDTVFYRDIAYLPFCEVGLEPDLPAIDADAFAAEMNTRAKQTPQALTTLTTHDTKRSAGARAVIMALSHMPELAVHLLSHGRELARQRDLPEAWGLYAVQTALIMRYADSAGQRIKVHIAKAMREAKTLSRHEAPNQAAEDAVADLCIAIHKALGDSDALWTAEHISRFEALFENIVLTQTALQLTAPGIPDIYQGTEVLNVMLTDPDNRRTIDWGWIEEIADWPARRLAGEKYDLTRRLLALRQEDPELFTHGSYEIGTGPDGDLWIRRHLDGREHHIDLPRGSGT